MNRLTPNRIALLRLALSLLQGGALWALVYSATSFRDPELGRALSVCALFVPTIAIAGLGNLRPRTLILWIVAAAILCFGLGHHAAWRDPSPRPFEEAVFFSIVNICLVGLLFIGHSLVVAGDADRRWIASFPTYFDVAWRHATQLALAVLFTAVFFGFLLLGAELFDLVKIGFLWRLLRADWFWIPAMTVAFAMAIHFTDTRTAMVRGARTLVLGLLSWLLPLLALIVIGFLCVLPFTGLAPLWATKHATSILLTAAIALILLINSHFQDGGPESRRFALLVHTRAAAALALLPLTVLAAIGLALRVEQHGWTPSRIVALAFVIAVGCHAIGYFIAVIRSRRELHGLPITNVLSALVVVGLMVALMSPAGDPARLSVRSQLARLESGAVPPHQFDFSFLKFDSGRYGQDALARLKDRNDGSEIARLAALEQTRSYRSGPSTAPPATPASRERDITLLHPRGGKLPESFMRMAGRSLDYRDPDCLRQEGARCDALLVDLDGDGVAEVVLVAGRSYEATTVYKEVTSGIWQPRGQLLNANCKGVIEALRRGDFQVVAPAGLEIVAGGQRLQAKADCGGR
jgi:hypothetical protein